jgi:hypothetical protein
MQRVSLRPRLKRRRRMKMVVYILPFHIVVAVQRRKKNLGLLLLHNVHD